MRSFFASAASRIHICQSNQTQFRAESAFGKPVFVICTQNQPDAHIFIFLDNFRIVHAGRTSLSQVNWDAKFSPDGQYLAVGVGTSPDLYMFEWDGSSLGLVAQFNTGRRVKRLAWNPDGTRLAAIFHWDNYVRVYSWDGSQISFVTSYELPGRPRAVHWSRCGGYIAVGHEGDTNLTLLEYASDTLSYVTETACSGVVYATYVLWGGQEFVVGTDTAPQLEIYRISYMYPDRVAYYDHGGTIYCLDMNDDENLILVSSSGGNKLAMYSWDGTNLELFAKPDPDYETPSSCFSPDEQYIASANYSEVRVFKWDGTKFHYIEQAYASTNNQDKYIDVSSVV